MIGVRATRFFKYPIRLFIAGFFIAAAIASAQAQTPASGDSQAAAITIPEDATPEFYRDLVSRLSDQQVRQILLDRLDAQAVAVDDAKSMGFWGFVVSSAQGVTISIIDAVSRIPKLFTVQGHGMVRFLSARSSEAGLTFIGYLTLAILLGGVAAFGARVVTKSWRSRIAGATGEEDLRETLRILGLRLALDASDLVAFVAVASLVLKLTLTGGDRTVAFLMVHYLIALPMAMAAMSRFLMAPHRPELRLVYTDDETARFLHRHQILLVLLIGLQIFILGFNQINNIPLGETRLGFWLNIGILSYLAFICYRARNGLSLMLLGRDEHPTRGEVLVARFYPYLMIASTVLTWLLIEILISHKMFHLLISGQPYWTLLLIGMAPALDTFARSVVRYLTPAMKGEGELAEEAHQSARRSYVRIARVVVFALSIFLIARIWQIDFTNLASAGFGARAAAAMIEVLVMIGFGFLVFEIVTLKINRKLADEHTAIGYDPNAEEMGGGDGGGTGVSRLATVLPLIRWVLQTSIVVITFLLALGNVGVDITPLLAGAGIVGLAIGFGAQKLVTDVVSGIFFLVDDAFRTGEYVEIDGTFGTVEKISIRSLQLRHHRGPVHTIPFGDIPRITNYSRDWVIMKMRFTVPFDTDLHKVKKIFKQIGAEIMEVPEFADDLLQTFKSQGVLEVDDVGIVIRGKFMAKPGTQFTLRKEIYSRVQKAFEANGIEFARREVRVKLAGENEGELSEEDQQTIAAAAAEAAGAMPEAGPAKP